MGRWVSEGRADGELAEEARAGDHTAFAALVTRYQQAIGGYLFRLTGDREVAFDLAQETFVRAYRALGHTRPGLQFKPWLYRIATNLAYDHLRRRRRIAWVSLHGIDRVVHADPPGSVEERDLVQQTLAHLRPDERAVLLLCGLEELSYPEAAAMLGGSAEAIRKRFTRAKEHFRRVYAALDEVVMP